jgi:hypothetical protein
LPLCVDEQIALAQRRSGWRRKRQEVAERRSSLDALKESGWERDPGLRVATVKEPAENVVDTLGLRVRGGVALECTSDLLHGMTRKSFRSLGGIEGLLDPTFEIHAVKPALKRARD